MLGFYRVLSCTLCTVYLHFLQGFSAAEPNHPKSILGMPSVKLKIGIKEENKGQGQV